MFVALICLGAFCCFGGSCYWFVVAAGGFDFYCGYVLTPGCELLVMSVWFCFVVVLW